jgi:hypothetical protein
VKRANYSPKNLVAVEISSLDHVAEYFRQTDNRSQCASFAEGEQVICERRPRILSRLSRDMIRDNPLVVALRILSSKEDRRGVIP